MDALEHIIGTRARDLARALVQTGEFTEERAELFVVLAGTDLARSIEWQRDELRSTRLSAPSTVRDLLSTMGAKRIAAVLDMPASTVWSGLRSLVPQLVELAEAESRRRSRPFAAELHFKRTRRAPFPA